MIKIQLLSAIFIFFLATCAQSTDFDCAKVNQSMKQLTCSDTTILQPDDTLGKAHQEDLEKKMEIELSSLSDFEIMLFGFSTCNFKDLYIDLVTKKPINSYFIERNIKPNALNDDMAIFLITEEFHELPVYSLTIPHYFPIVEIGFDAPLNVVIEKLSPFLNNGFYKSFPENIEVFDKPLIMEDRKNPQKTTLTCD